jgi:hypothetical protein
VRELSQGSSFSDTKLENVTVKKCLKVATVVTCWDGHDVWQIKEEGRSLMVKSGVMAIGSDGYDRVVMI